MLTKFIKFSYAYKGQSICSVLVNMQHHEVVQTSVTVVKHKYVFTRFEAENDLSLTVLVAGMTSHSFARVEI